VVHSDHASISHRYGDMAPQILDARTWTQKDGRMKKEREKGGKGRKKESGKKEEKGKGEKKWKVKERGKGKGIEKGKEKKKGRKKGRERGKKKK